MAELFDRVFAWVFNVERYNIVTDSNPNSKIIPILTVANHNINLDWYQS